MKNITPLPGKYIIFGLITTIILSACTNFLVPASPTPNAQATEQFSSIQQTQVVLNITVQAHQAAETQAALATATPLPTETPLPSPTSTPGPVIIQDDFSVNTGRWAECGQCVIENGVMRMGPYPISITGEAYTAICRDCGVAQDYKMGVDATFVDGYTDRGFGLLLREVDGSYVDVEITTWQVYGVWLYDKKLNNWGTLLNDGWTLTGNLRPSAATNRLEVEVTSSGGTSTINIHINGQLTKSTTMPAISGRVGLVVGLHSLGVVFDNFYFEGYPVRQLEVETPPSQQG
jgi:hypothetical protein